MSEIVNNLSHRAGVRHRSAAAHGSYLQEGLIHLFDLVQNWSNRHRARGHLYQMPDYMLRDIGVSRSEVEVEYNKPFWRA
jgi:uncharacterized protein YjiS (DUF1127 family)